MWKIVSFFYLKNWFDSDNFYKYGYRSRNAQVTFVEKLRFSIFSPYHFLIVKAFRNLPEALSMINHINNSRKLTPEPFLPCFSINLILLDKKQRLVWHIKKFIGRYFHMELIRNSRHVNFFLQVTHSSFKHLESRFLLI